MKRYATFSAMDYSAMGGWDDFVGTFATVAEAVAAGEAEVKRSICTWHHVVDLRTGVVVAESIRVR